MRAAVFTRYWQTGGGGERYGGAIAEALARDLEVELLGVGAVDLAWLAERLGLDLSRVTYRELDEEVETVTQASARYDLFVNISYLSADPCAAPHGIYVVMFPNALDADRSALERALVRRLPGLHVGPDVRMSWGEGVHQPEPGRRGATWTGGAGTLLVTTPPGVTVPIEIELGRQRPATTLPTTVSLEVGGTVVATAELRPSSRLGVLRPTTLRAEVTSPEDGTPVALQIRSDTFVPATLDGSDDRRRLGVPVRRVRHAAGGPASGIVAQAVPALYAIPLRAGWLDSYAAVVSISEYTRTWVQRRWDRDTPVLHPPVSMYAAGPKGPVILSVGRFFARDRGHSKKQLEMVQAFRRLCDGGVTGWELHLAGGCAEADRPYLEEVREAAAGYPVELHIDRPGAELRELYARASIYWHAAGLGEHPDRHPDRMEHFGITTVEAMSAGAVPVVIGVAGQIETVRHGVDGFHFQTVDGLVSLTRSLIDDEPLRADLAAAAVARARSFSVAAFDEQLAEIVAGALRTA